MPTKNNERYFFYVLLFLAFIFTFFIFRPFLIILVLGASFAIILSPFQKWFKRHRFSNWFASFITVFIFLLLICGPLFGLGILVFKQSQSVYSTIVSNGTIVPFMDKANTTINKLLPSEISFNLNDKASGFISLVTNNIAQVFSTTVTTIFSFILMILAIFYFLKDGPEWKKSLLLISPMPDEDDQTIIERFKQTVNGVIKGSLLIALIQGLLMGLGLAIFGVPNPALWGVIAGLTSLIPSLGTSLVSIPSIIFLFLTRHFPQAIGLLIWAAIMVGMIDNFLGPSIVGRKIQIPEFLILFSVLGGISLLGPVGFLIGPLSVSLLYTLVSMYQTKYKQSMVL